MHMIVAVIPHESINIGVIMMNMNFFHKAKMLFLMIS